MSLDEAIKYYSHLADECRRKAHIERNDYMDLKDLAAEHEQLADWLNELKVLREKIQKLLEKQSVDKCCETCKNRSRSAQEIPCCDCYMASCFEDCYEPLHGGRSMTNRERLAQMTNEELAEFICKQHVMCLNCVGRDMCCTNGNGALAWLEAEEEEQEDD